MDFNLKFEQSRLLLNFSFKTSTVKVIMSLNSESNISSNSGLDEIFQYVSKLVQQDNRLVFMQEIHGDNFKQVKSDDLKERFVILNSTDGIYTKLKDVFICGTFADCIPIIFVSEHYIFLIHAGWRGIYKSIHLKGLNILKSLYSQHNPDIWALILPHIKQCCFCVSQDVERLFLPEYKECISRKAAGSFISLLDIVKYDLKKNFPQLNFFCIDECTKCRPDKYISRRNNMPGQMIVGVKRLT